MFRSLLLCNLKYCDMRSHFPMPSELSIGAMLGHQKKVLDRVCSRIFNRSTCSHYEAENEGVVHAVGFFFFFDELLCAGAPACSNCKTFWTCNLLIQVLRSAACDGWSLATALPGWHRRGTGKYAWADKCARVNSEEDFSGGFFVALFERSRCKNASSRRARKLPNCALRSFYGSILMGLSK